MYWSETWTPTTRQENKVQRIGEKNVKENFMQNGILLSGLISM